MKLYKFKMQFFSSKGFIYSNTLIIYELDTGIYIGHVTLLFHSNVLVCVFACCLWSYNLCQVYTVLVL